MRLSTLALALFLAALLGFSASAEAQTRTYKRIIRFSTGTGFFINQDGYVLTNNHVVRNCAGGITVEGAVPESKATLIAYDPANDLALLRTDATPPEAAGLRADSYPIAEEERVVTVGFPENHDLTTREALILSTRGPTGEDKWLQFSDSIKQGNSGGPLLDGSGNVVGVVVAKATISEYETDASRPLRVEKADIAITLPVVRKFLSGQRVRYRDSTRQSWLDANRVEERARDFIVHVKCRLNR